VFGLSSEYSVKSFRHDSRIQNFYFAAGLTPEVDGYSDDVRLVREFIKAGSSPVPQTRLSTSGWGRGLLKAAESELA
jgi:hypothetical protein